MVFPCAISDRYLDDDLYLQLWLNVSEIFRSAAISLYLGAAEISPDLRRNVHGPRGWSRPPSFTRRIMYHWPAILQRQLARISHQCVDTWAKGIGEDIRKEGCLN
jgi:hypothetical protein